MKKAIFLILSVVLFAVATNAQKPDSAQKAKMKSRMQNDTANRKGGFITPENMKFLELSKDQEKQIVDMHNQNKKDKQKVKDDTSLTEDQKKEKLKTFDRAYKDKAEALLTPDQKKKYEAKKKEMKSKNGGANKQE